MDKLVAAHEDFVRRGMLPPKLMSYGNSGDTDTHSLNPGSGTGDENNCVDNGEAPVVDNRDIDVDDVQVVAPSLALVGHRHELPLTSCRLGVRQVRPPSDIYLPEKAGMSASTTSTPLT